MSTQIHSTNEDIDDQLYKFVGIFNVEYLIKFAKFSICSLVFNVILRSLRSIGRFSFK